MNLLDVIKHIPRDDDFMLPGMRGFFANPRQERCPFENCAGEVFVFLVESKDEKRERYQAVEVDKHSPDCLVASFERWRKS